MPRTRETAKRVADWLRSLGLSQYAEAFEQNAITWELLPQLTDQDLYNLGVVALGHRKKLLKALAALEASRDAWNPRTVQLERRHLTVMLCDLVGSTALSVRFDPEDLRDIIVGYLACCENIIRRFHGHIARCVGDSLLVYFGYPSATEHDAGRAVQAGLEIVNAVHGLRLRPQLALQTRIGIATGEVVAGASEGKGEVQEPTIVGEAPNLASRLQALAEPDSVVIAETTRRLLGDRFECCDLGLNEIVGFSEPIQVWRAVSERPDAIRTEINDKRITPTRLIGRVDEMGMLEARWRRAKTGTGQVVLLSGEAGIGKSRLARALRERLSEEASTVVHYYGSPYHENTSLYPIITQLESAAQLIVSDPSAAKLEKLDAFLSRFTGEVRRAIPLFASLLSLPTEGRYPSLGLTGRRLKERTLEALEALIIGVTRRKGTGTGLIVFEDLQWVDPTTRELLARLITRATNLPVLLLMTCRPEFTARWEHEPQVLKCILNRLSPTEAKAVVGEFTGRKPLPAEVLDQIIVHCDGLPLCLEEMTKTVMEMGYLTEEAGRYTRTMPLPEVVIPETLQDSLMARLDRLGRWKEAARTAAVIGRQFSYKLLFAVLPAEEMFLREALDELMRAELIVGRGNPPDAMYTFKHALVRDAAYMSLMRAERQALHARIAHILDEQFPETGDREPELLARHYTGAKLLERAIRYWYKAGEQALTRCANIEAINHFRKGLELLLTLPDSPERDQHELDLQIALGATLTATKGFAAPEVEIAYTRARYLSERLADSELRFSVLRGFWIFDLVRARWQQARELAAEMLALSQSENRSAYMVEAERALGVTLLWLGEFETACEHLQKGRLQYNHKQHHVHARRYGNDPGIACLVHEALVLWILGYPDRALARSVEALSLATQLQHPFSIAQALLYRSFLHQHRGEVNAAATMAEEARIISAEHGFAFWSAESSIVYSWALGQQGEVAQGLQSLREGLADFLATGAKMDQPRWLAALAETYVKNGQLYEGLQAVSESLEAVERTGERLYEARLYGLKGDLLLQQNRPGAAPEAESCYLLSLTIARRQAAKSWELRAATSLARLWFELGKSDKAHNLLRPIYDWFTEGFDTGDLQNAKTALDRILVQ